MDVTVNLEPIVLADLPHQIDERVVGKRSSDVKLLGRVVVWKHCREKREMSFVVEHFFERVFADFYVA